MTTFVDESRRSLAKYLLGLYILIGLQQLMFALTDFSVYATSWITNGIYGISEFEWFGFIFYYSIVSPSSPITCFWFVWFGENFAHSFNNGKCCLHWNLPSINIYCYIYVTRCIILYIQPRWVHILCFENLFRVFYVINPSSLFENDFSILPLPIYTSMSSNILSKSNYIMCFSLSIYMYKYCTYPYNSNLMHYWIYYTYYIHTVYLFSIDGWCFTRFL